MTGAADVDDAPRIPAADEAAFAAWCAAHPPPARRVPGLEHARWMQFSAERLLARPRPASGGAPPATSTERDR